MNECPRCHSEVGMDDQFCGKCGLSLQDVGAVTQTADTAGMEANNLTQISTAAPTMPQSATELPLHLPPPPPSNVTPVLYQDQSSANVANPHGVLPPPQSPHDNTSPTPPRKSTNRGLIVLLAFLAGVLAIGGSLFAFAASHTGSSPAVPTDTPVPTATQQAVPTDIPTSIPTTAPTSAPTQPPYSGSTAVPTPTKSWKPTPTPTTEVTPTPSPAVTPTPTSGAGY